MGMDFWSCCSYSLLCISYQCNYFVRNHKRIQKPMSVFFTLLSLGVAAACFAIRDLISHGKFSYGPSEGFWGEQSWRRKYASNNGLLDLPLSNWYYDLFKIPYLERFPLSATLLVFLTDGYHLMTLFMQLSIFAAISVGDWKMLLACWITWSLFFNVFYTVFNRN